MREPPRAIVIHSLEHALCAARAARALGAGVRLQSAPGAGGYAGAGWFAEILAAVRRAHPDLRIEAVLDCGESPGHALAAFRRGIEAVRFEGTAEMREKLGAIAAAHGAVLDPGCAPALDLATVPDAAAACASWLSDGCEHGRPA